MVPQYWLETLCFWRAVTSVARRLWDLLMRARQPFAVCRTVVEEVVDAEADVKIPQLVAAEEDVAVTTPLRAADVAVTTPLRAADVDATTPLRAADVAVTTPLRAADVDARIICTAVRARRTTSPRSSTAVRARRTTSPRSSTAARARSMKMA